MTTARTPCGIAIPQSAGNLPIQASFLQDFLRRAETSGYDSLWVQEQIIVTPPFWSRSRS